MKSYAANPVFTHKLIDWYQNNHRQLPWRDTKDPYQIWLSEIILQQTRVRQGLPYFLDFTQSYQTVKQLAAAPQQEVLRKWQGLGYYSRARNLHKCAQEVTNKYDGRFPSEYPELIKLPGVGDYTASAIASFAFGKYEPVVDGNVFRVLSRVFGITLDISKASTRKHFKALSSVHQQTTDPALYNQALMEFGALQCTPKSPDCGQCIFSDMCFANSRGRQSQLPVKNSKTKVRERHMRYYLIRYQNQILMRKRTSKDIWQGLYDFLCFETSMENEALPDFPAMSVGEPSPLYKHKLSHQLIQAHFTEVFLHQKTHLDAFKKRYQLEEFKLEEIHDLPKPILIHNYLKASIF